MRLEKIQDLLREKHISFDYTEEEGCGSIDFEYRGLSYHIWEYADGDGPCGVETNVANVGRTRELEGNYEEQVLEILRQFYNQKRVTAGGKSAGRSRSTGLSAEGFPGQSAGAGFYGGTDTWKPGSRLRLPEEL